MLGKCPRPTVRIYYVDIVPDISRVTGIAKLKLSYSIVVYIVVAHIIGVPGPWPTYSFYNVRVRESAIKPVVYAIQIVITKRSSGCGF
jgi:hypothetical protein